MRSGGGGVGAVCGDEAFEAGVAACALEGKCGGWDDFHAVVLDGLSDLLSKPASLRKSILSLL
jgi:hypothetical protein